MAVLIVGLGNPGQKFNNTRHNFGFLALDDFTKKKDFPEFLLSKKFDSLVSEKEKVLLSKPQTFMNNSGIAVKKIAKNQKLLIVIHDDMDLPLGIIRIAKNRGSAGHKGVESIIKALGTEDFIRIRLGVLPKTGKPKNSEKFVLQKFTKEEESQKNQVIEKTTKALGILLKDGLEKAMNEYNK